MNKKINLSIPLWARLLIIPFIGILVFGVLAKDLGFYWDDWAKTLVNVLFGFEGYRGYYASDRPLSGWTHILFVSLIGNNQLLWQYLNLALRILAAYGMWWSFSFIWPKAKREVALVSVLYFVIPIFTQQPVAVTFHQQWLQACLYFLALGFAFLAVEKPRFRWLFIAISLAANALQLTVTEYFLGMVLAIPLLLLLYFRRRGLRGKSMWITTLKASVPHLILIAVYMLWRFKLMPLASADPYGLTLLSNLRLDPLGTLLNLGKVSLLDMLQVLVGSWSPVFDLSIDTAASPMTIFSWLVSAASAVAIVVAFSFNAKTLHEDDEKSWIGQFILIGLLALVAGLLPAWITDRQLLTDFHSNRYAMPGMFGAGFMIVGVLSWFVQNWQRKVIVVGLLAGLAAGYHLRIVNDYRWNWNDQTTLYWQLFWRAPHIMENTAIFFEDEPIANQGLFSTSAALNLLYRHEPVSGDLPYWAYTILPRYAAANEAPKNQPLHSKFRTLEFNGNTDAAILLHYDPNHGTCWWVLNETDQQNPYISEQERAWISNSNLSRIEMPDQYQTPSETLFGQEPSHDWCYLYEKAELAVQYQDWKDAIALADQAQTMGYQPDQSSANSPREWMPFIEAYVNMDNLDKALEITLQNYQLDPKYQPMLCTMWHNLLNVQDDEAWLAKIDEAINCSDVQNSGVIMLEP